MNTDDITIFMGKLRSTETKCPSCNEKKHTKECDFGDFRVVDDLSALYVDPAFESSSELRNAFLGFLTQRATKLKYLDGVCYVLTNDIVYKNLGIEESEMLRVFNQSIHTFWAWRSVNTLLRKNHVLRNKRDESLPTKIKQILKALDLYIMIKSGAVGHYNVNSVSTRQKMIAQYMMYYLQRILRRL